MESKDNITFNDRLCEYPVCNGAGTFALPKRRKANHTGTTSMIKILHKAGYSYREIAALVGYKSPRSIQIHLNK